MASQIQRVRKTSADIKQPIGQAFRDIAQQEIMRGEAGGRTVAMPPDGATVENAHRFIHARNMGASGDACN